MSTRYNLTRRQFLKNIGMLSAGFTVASAMTGCSMTPQAKPSSQKPNLVFIYSDDQSWLHAGAYGDTVVKTPVFDLIAEQGVLFNHAFVSAPSCAPSRAAVLTGRNIWELESASNLWGVFPDSLTTYSKLLLEAGYQVGNSGKGYQPGRSDVTWANNPTGNGGGNFPTFFNNRDKTKPFCYWFGSHHPHRPFDKGSGVAAGKKIEDVAVPDFLPDADEVRSDILDYYVAIETYDSQMQSIYQTLSEAGALHNTLIIVSSDNGMCFPRAKANLYDGGTRVPLAIMWLDRIPGGRVLDDFVNIIDFAPTFLEAAGVPVPPEMTGRSLLPILTSGQSGLIDSTRDRVYVGRERHTSARDENYGYPCRAVRTKDYLYIWNIHPERWPAGNPSFYHDIGPGATKSWLLNNRDAPEVERYFKLACAIRPEHELYDLRRDPSQLKNAAYNPAYQDILNHMQTDLKAYLTKTGDPHMFGNGDAFETYEQIRGIRNIAYVEPGEPFIDSLQGEPIVSVTGKLRTK